jgi:TonB family protein
MQNLIRVSFITSVFICGLLLPSIAQDDGCDKCSMLREDYENATGTKKEEIYAFFKSECLDSQTEYLGTNQQVTDSSSAETVKVILKGKCLDYSEVSVVDIKSRTSVLKYKVVRQDTVYQLASEMPQFPGGDAELVKYFNTRIRYPEEARKANQQGTVYVRFILNGKGKAEKIYILRSPHAGLEKEAVRVIESMPDWKPARHENRPVKIEMVVPVRFALR